MVQFFFSKFYAGVYVQNYRWTYGRFSEEFFVIGQYYTLLNGFLYMRHI